MECFRDPFLPMAIGPTRSDKRVKLDGQQSFALPGLWLASLWLLVTPLSIAHLLARAFSTARQPRTGTVRLGYLCCVKCRKSLPGYTTIFMCNYRHFVSSRLRNQTEHEGLSVCPPASR